MTTTTDGGKRTVAAGWETNYHDVGEGEPVLFLHGSGPGVSALANWRLVLPELSQSMRCIAPDAVGFGFSARPDDIQYGIDAWVRHAIGLLDALGLEKVSIVGNSLGGRIALGIAAAHPERVRRLVLMGSSGPGMQPTEGLKALRSYEPSVENMRQLMQVYFAYDPSIVTDDLVRARYEASALPGAQETYYAMFHDPRHSGSSTVSAEDLSAIQVPTLVVHGREDKVVPLESGLTLTRLLPNVQLHVFSGCGHWVQIEKAAQFTHLTRWFLESD
jgi:pimeloyl-ACP methyl ester carboxylesterase